MCKRILRGLWRLAKDERGITGLETAIILIAFVIVASVFAFVVLSTGLFSAERGKETVFAGLQKAQANLELHGSVVVTSSGGTPDNITFELALAAGGAPINLDPDATTNTVVMNYIDQDAREADIPYTVNWILGDGDSLLEPGELAEISIALPTPSGNNLSANEHFTIEVIATNGGTMLIARTMPAGIDPVMDLH
ncbi:MAG: archaellin/type IV pilin N-terminal domain-containing protein [Dehalococcoidia bacterium]|nr:archaellin/type IV pilin N-terminal domain-containing protein [Dehalococcoidia bacterium]